MKVAAHLLAAAVSVTLVGCNRAADRPAANQADTAEQSNVAEDPGMGMPIPCKAKEGVSEGKFCGFKATLNLFPPVKQPALTITGDFALNSRTGRAYLREGLIGINQKILIVDVKTDTSSGKGGYWYPVEENKFGAERDQYESVTIREPGGTEIHVPVDSSE